MKATRPIMRTLSLMLTLLLTAVSSRAANAKALPNEPAPNSLTVEAVSAGRMDMHFRLTDYTRTLDTIQASVPGATPLDRSTADRPPAFVFVMEVDTGRYAEVQALTVEHTLVPMIDHQTQWLPDEAVVEVKLARMGRRAFLRVEVRPFQPNSKANEWHVYESIDATIRVSENLPPKRAVREPVLFPAEWEETGPCAVCPPPMPLTLSSGAGGQAADFLARRAVTNDIAWKIMVSESGLYRVTGADLAQAGVPAAYRDTTLLHMTVCDQPVPLWTSGPGPMQADDWLMFYGAAVQSSYTTQNVYWLTVGDASPAPALDNAEPGIGSPVTSAWAQVDFAPKNIYAAAYNPLDASYDHWFATNVQGGATASISFDTPYPVQTGNVHLAYSLHGVRGNAAVNPDHRSILRVGAEQVVATNYNGQKRVRGEASASAAALGSGTTSVSLEQVLLAGVSSFDAAAYIESLALCYERQLIADELPFYFSGPLNPAPVQVRLQDHVQTNGWLLDVTDPFAPQQLTDYALTNDAGSTVLTFQDGEGGRRCLAVFSEQGIMAPSAIELVRFRGLADPGRQADYLAVAPHEFRAPIFRLLTHRYKNELTVQVATPDDVFNEFSYGLVDPMAIRQYFGYAYHHYQKNEPRYALLVGAGSEDPLNHLGHADPNIMPTLIGWAPFVRTALEQWFVMVDGPDPVPDMALGRIAAASATEVHNAVEKIIASETAPTNASWRETALLVADEFDDSLSINFKEHVDGNTRNHLLNGGFAAFDIATAYRDDQTQSQVRQAIQGGVNNGVHLVHYMGHGGVTQWSSPGVWNLSDTANSTNAIHPIVAVFTCRSGAFHIPTVSALGEVLVMSPSAASACVAPTGLSDQWHAERLADGFYQALAEDRVERLGDALQDGFLHLWSEFPAARELYFYTILGDPAQSVWGGATP